MCRSCGAIVGAGQTQCGVCGASTAARPSNEPGQRTPDKETIRFARAVLSRPYKFTIALLVANLFVFMMMWSSSGLSFRALVQFFPDNVLRVYGAQLNYLINAPNNQWWRLITSMFVHINLPHLVMNMFSLLIIGPFVEKLYGSAKFVVFWVISGLAGSLATYLSLRPSLARSDFEDLLSSKQRIYPQPAHPELCLDWLVFFLYLVSSIAVNCRKDSSGFLEPDCCQSSSSTCSLGFVGRSFIGNAAHLGGLFAGAALALFIDYRRPGARAGINVAWRVLQVLLLAIIALGAYKVVRNFHRPLPAQANVTSPNTNRLSFF